MRKISLQLVTIFIFLFLLSGCMPNSSLLVEDKTTNNLDTIQTSLNKHTTALMGYKDNIQGFSIVGSPADKNRCNYVYDCFKLLGLSNVRQESVLLDSWIMGDVYISFSCDCNEKGDYTAFDLLPYPANINLNGDLVTLQDIGNGDEAGYKGKDVNGKGVLVYCSEDYDIKAISALANSKGASMLFICEPTVSAAGLTSDSYSVKADKGELSLPIFFVSKGTYTLLSRNMQLGLIDVRVTCNSVLTSNVPSNFVLGEIKGTSDELYYITSNRDSITTDYSNTLGLGELLLLAERFMVLSETTSPIPTIRFMVTTGSQWGKIGYGDNEGIRAYLGGISEQELSKVQGVFVIDSGLTGSNRAIEPLLRDTDGKLTKQLKGYTETYKPKYSDLPYTVNILDLTDVSGTGTEGVVWMEHSAIPVFLQQDVTMQKGNILCSSVDTKNLYNERGSELLGYDYFGGFLEKLLFS